MKTLSDDKLAEIAGQVPNLDANNVRFIVTKAERLLGATNDN